MKTITSAATALAAAALLTFDAGAQPRRSGDPRGSVSDIINSRRLLDLTPRQLTQLDSIERTQFRARSEMRNRLETRRDSLCANRRPCVLSREERAAFQDWADSQRPRRADMLRNDSLTRDRVLSVLDSTQRSRLSDLRPRRAGGREMRQGPGMGERRGMREMRGPRGMRDMRQMRGTRELRRREMRDPRFSPGRNGFAPRRQMEMRRPMSPRLQGPDGPGFAGPPAFNRRGFEDRDSIRPRAPAAPRPPRPDAEF
jgi:hypothetical protein